MGGDWGGTPYSHLFSKIFISFTPYSHLRPGIFIYIEGGVFEGEVEWGGGILGMGGYSWCLNKY